MKKQIIALAVASTMLVAFHPVASAQGGNELLDRAVAPAVEQTEVISSSLTLEQQERILADIKEQLQAKYGSVYKLDNFSATFEAPVVEDHMIYIDLNVDADMTLTRHPADSPYVQGMEAALAEVTEDSERELAQLEIDNFLQEVEPYYNTPSPSAFLYRIQLDSGNELNTNSLSSIDENSSYELFHRADITEEEAILTPVKPAETLDESSASELGRQSIQSAISSTNQLSQVMKAAVSYDRIAARDYALDHGLDEPEFSKANNMGSDCANFVSKALRAGGFPVDKAGKWYPSPKAGSYAGENWMRTGYYNNGGVVPYMVDKGYFYKQTKQNKVNAGSILSRTDTSHVALVTYGDGSVIKYTEHSNVKVKKTNVVYAGEKAEFYMPN
ncbi:amidase domain-containing protein [Paenibacillus sp. FSL K6-1230]|uniref:amidase domain-containing protein n=1 Tax=Paenibacillus sp. FSL K6-1230 TaxID=2921603 RepID=UPI0003AA678D